MQTPRPRGNPCSFEDIARSGVDAHADIHRRRWTSVEPWGRGGARLRTSEVEGLLHATGRFITLSWISERIVRVESEPVLHRAAQGISSFWGGDPTQLAALVERVLLPLAKSYGVVAVRMGGYLDRRA